MKKINDKLKEVDIEKQFGIVYGFNFEEAVIWYNIADENLTTSKVLIDNHRFAHAAFFMQQSVECFIKGILIHSEILSPYKVKSVSHDIESVFCEFYKKIGDEYYFNTIQNIHSKLQEHTSFSDKITMIIIPCANNIIEQFERAKTDLTFGFHTIHGYITNMLILFSILLDRNIQQDTRYYYNDSYPCEKYTESSQLDKVLEYLISVNEWIKFLTNHNSIIQTPGNDIDLLRMNAEIDH